MSQPLTEEQFRRSIYEKYPKHFDHTYALLDFAQQAMTSYRGFVRSPYHASLNLLFARAYKSYDSVRSLCEIAHCEDAGVILRSLLNLLVVIRWISLDKAKRSARYLHWYWVGMNREVDSFREKISSVQLQVIRERFGRVKTQFEYRDKRGHLRLVNQWYQPEATTIRDLFAEVGLQRHYEEAYRPLSSIEHSDCTAFFPMIVGTTTEGGERRIDIQSDLYVPHYLRNAFQYFGDAFTICNETNPLCDEVKLKQVLDAGKAFFEHDMKAKGIDPN